MTSLQYTILAILDDAKRHEQHQWSIQGFGMLRLYVRDVARIHIWHSALRYPGVSMIHNHSWDLVSTVVVGQIINTRFKETAGPCKCYGHRDCFHGPQGSYHTQRRITGYQTVEVGPIVKTYLRSGDPEYYGPGDTYAQKAHVIHQTGAQDGTVTVMERKEDTEGQADIYWPHGTEWGTAKPRAATYPELLIGVNAALSLLGL